VSDDLAGFAAVAREAARIAGAIIMPLYESGTAVELKADRTPVTLADRRAEEAIREFLLRECPKHGVMGEEFGETPGAGRYRWVLDPIDGTKAFIHHVPLFGTLIALEDSGAPVVGLIACHAVGETAWAAKGLGAWINDAPARVSTISDLADATISTTSFQRQREKYPAGFARMCDNVGLLRTWGDCYGYLQVAAGRAEAMLDPDMNHWDVAALYPVITEAGGRITTWSGDERPGASAIATNGILHQAVLELFNE